MTRERWQRLRALFAELRITPAGDLPRAVQQACPDDPTLGQELLAMLEADAQDDTIFDRLPALEELVPGQRLGPYRIREAIGQGGTSDVYLAERDDGQFQLHVAVKVLKATLIPAVHARFARERQLLAAIEHSNIARIIDSGVTPGGAPYLVMDYIDGRPVDEFADSLDLKARIRLFAECAEAVAYLHRFAIVHRDLKPGNILVTAQGQPKLLDFGLARLLDEGRAMSHSQTTVWGFRMLTPEYASPEQFRGGAASTACDIYALGVLLYRITTGRLPFEMDGMPFEKALRLVCETRPPNPAAVALIDWPRHWRRDLSSIILKAMEPAAGARYVSADALRADLIGLLEGRAVTARDSTWGYRAGKWVRRRWLAISVAALVTTLLLLAGAVALQQSRIAARRQAELQRAVTSLLVDANEKMADLPGANETRRALVSQAVGYLDRLYSEAARDRALALALTDAYRRIGDLEGNPFEIGFGQPALALQHFERALELAKSTSREKPDNPASQESLARCYLKLAEMHAHPLGFYEPKTAVSFFGMAETALSSLPPEWRRKREVRLLEGILADRCTFLYRLIPGREADAQAQSLRALRIREAEAAAAPADPERQMELSSSLMLRAGAEPDNFKRDLSLVKRAVAILTDVHARNPSSVRATRLLGRAHAYYGMNLYRRNRLAEAEESLRPSYTYAHELLDFDPAANVTRTDTAQALDRLALIRALRGSQAESDRLRDQEWALLRDGARYAPKVPPPKGACPPALGGVSEGRSEGNPVLSGKGLLVADASGRIVLVSRSSGNQQMLSEGGLLQSPTGVAISGNGDVYVSDSGAFHQSAGVIRLEFDGREWRQRAVACGESLLKLSQPWWDEATGKLMVISYASENGYEGSVVSIEPNSGRQTVIQHSDAIARTLNVAVDSGGLLYMAAHWATEGGPAHVWGLDPRSGQAHNITRWGLLKDPGAIALADPRTLWLLDFNAFGPVTDGALVAVDIHTGRQRQLWEGRPLVQPLGIVREPESTWLISDSGVPDGYPVILRYDPLHHTMRPLSERGLLKSPAGIVLTERGL